MQQSELNYFKDILEERKNQITKNISGVNEELMQLGKEELNDDCDYATNSNYSSVESAIVSQQQHQADSFKQQWSTLTNHSQFCKECY